VDAVCGHLLLARQNVARALALKVDEGAFTLPDARRIARALFHDNPKELFLGR